MKRPVCILKNIGQLCILTLFTLTAGIQTQTANAQSEKEANVPGTQALEIWNKGNLALIDELYTPDFVRHNVAVSEDIEGLEAFKAYVAAVRTTYPDFTVTTDQQIIMDDLRVSRWTVNCTNTGPSDQLPPTGKKVKVSGASIIRYEVGKIAEEWVYWNQATVLTQLGYTITPPVVAPEK